jgi:hypothetical protein
MSSIGAVLGGPSWPVQTPPANANSNSSSSTAAENDNGANENSANNNAINGGTLPPPVQAATAPGTGQKVDVMA